MQRQSSNTGDVRFSLGSGTVSAFTKQSDSDIIIFEQLYSASYAYIALAFPFIAENKRLSVEVRMKLNSILDNITQITSSIKSFGNETFKKYTYFVENILGIILKFNTEIDSQVQLKETREDLHKLLHNMQFSGYLETLLADKTIIDNSIKKLMEDTNTHLIACNSVKCVLPIEMQLYEERYGEGHAGDFDPRLFGLLILELINSGIKTEKDYIR